MSVSLNIRRLWQTAGTIGLLTGLLVAAATAEASPEDLSYADSPLALASDTTAVPEWARQVVSTRRALEAAEQAYIPEEARRLAAEAFEAARELVVLPSMRRDASVRALYLQAHALYEAHLEPIPPIALSPAEIGALRGEALAQLSSENPEWLHGAGPPDPEIAEPPAPLVPDHLWVPEHAEPIVAREEQRLQRTFRGFGGVHSRGRRYFPMITRALGRQGLPAEMKYVAVIESSLDPQAISAAGAIGLWQFLPTTGAMYGLSEGDLYNPTRSTYAATRHLKRLYRMFDDWQLALAAYNCGSGCVQNAVRSARRTTDGQPTFWDIYPHLPAETRAYVPKFIALARLLG